jgi:hypothetical protein
MALTDLTAIAALVAGIGILYESYWARALARILAFTYSTTPVGLVGALYVWRVLIPATKLEQLQNEGIREQQA